MHLLTSAGSSLICAHADHEKLIAAIAEQIGFTQISVSSVVSRDRLVAPMVSLTASRICAAQISPQIKMVPRATSTSADSYLTPVLKLYLSGFFAGFDDKLSAGNESDQARVEFMTSEGTLVSVNTFGGLKSLLSGPAGGVVGYSLTSWDEEIKQPLIGFDMVSQHSLANALAHTSHP